MVSNCLVPGGPWDLGQRNIVGLVCELEKEVVGAIDSELVGLHMKEVISAEPFIISNNRLALARASLLRQQDF